MSENTAKNIENVFLVMVATLLFLSAFFIKAGDFSWALESLMLTIKLGMLFGGLALVCVAFRLWYLASAFFVFGCVFALTVWGMPPV